MYFLIAQAENVENISFGWAAAKMVFAMIGVIVFALLVIRYVLPKLTQVRRREDSSIEVLDMQPLAPRRSVYLVKIEDKKIAVGMTENGMTKLCEWDT